VEDETRGWSERSAPAVGQGLTERKTHPILLGAVATGLILLIVLLTQWFGGSSPQTPAEAIARGLDAQSKGKLTDAERNYRIAVHLDPRNKFAQYDLGVVEQAEGNTPAARSDYLRALDVDPNFVPALYNLAILLTRSQPLDAMTIYRRLLRIEPNNARAHANLGAVLLSLGKKAEGNKELDTAIALDPSIAGRVEPVKQR